MEPDHLADAPPDAIPHYRAAETALDTEAEAALRQIIRFRENGEMGTGTALPMAVNRVEICFAHQLALHRGPSTARELEPGVIRA